MDENDWTDESENGENMPEEVAVEESDQEDEEEEGDQEDEEELTRIKIRYLVEEVVPIEVPHDDLQLLKYSIRSQLGIDDKNVSIDFQGVPLQENRLLSTYNIQNGDSLYLSEKIEPRWRDFIHLYVKTPYEVIPVWLNKQLYLKNLKQKLFELLGIPIKYHRIVFDGRLRTDPQELVSTYGHGSKVYFYTAITVNVTIRTVSDNKEYPLSIECFNTGIEVKKKIFEILRITPSAQRVLIDDILVEDDMLMIDYKITQPCILNVYENTDSGTRIKFSVKTPAGKMVEIDTDRLKSVYSVKHRLQDVEGIPIEEQRLFLKDTELLDWQSMGEAKVLNDYKLDLYVRCKVPLTLNLLCGYDKQPFKILKMQFDIREDVGFLMHVFERTLKIPIEKQNITNESGYTYIRKGHTLAYYGIESGSEINLKIETYG